MFSYSCPQLVDRADCFARNHQPQSNRMLSLEYIHIRVADSGHGNLQESHPIACARSRNFYDGNLVLATENKAFSVHRPPSGGESCVRVAVLHMFLFNAQQSMVFHGFCL